MKVIRAADIARKTKRSPMFISLLLKGERHTIDANLAFELGNFSGNMPINFIVPKLRDVYLKAHPELAKASK